MKLLAIHSSHHDVNLSYFDGEVVRYHKTERSKQFKRHYFENHYEALQEATRLWNINLQDIDYIAITMGHDKQHAKNGIDIDDAINSVYFPATDIRNLFEDDQLWWVDHPRVIYVNHHFCHALSTWMLAEKTDVQIVIDGLGNYRTWSVFRDNQLVECGQLVNGSIGFGMREMASVLGIAVPHQSEEDAAGKAMGLQSYGVVNELYLQQLRQFGMYNITQVFSFDLWRHFNQDPLVAELTKIDWARTVHERLGEILVEFFHRFAKPNETISYAGGVAQNVIWNTKLRKEFPNLVIPTHASDEGLSLGALEFLRQYTQLPPFSMPGYPYVESDEAPEEPTEETIKRAAQLLAEGKIVAWYQGHGEVGPRALGNRSILMDPRIKDGKNIINRVKRRENYRPFGASVLEEHAKDYFGIDQPNPYMLYVGQPKDDTLDAITHVDNTCRVQTVDNSNPAFRKLLEEFYTLTTCPVLLNTSLNTAGKPIAGYKNNAKELFYSTFIDCVIIGNEILTKENINASTSKPYLSLIPRSSNSFTETNQRRY